MIQALARTKPWVRFISVLMFIGAAFMLLAGLMMFAMGSKLGELTKSPMYAGGVGVAMAVTYAVLAFVYIFPALKLWKYATYIGNLLASGTMQDLETALNEQRSFWKFIGILFLIMIALYVVLVVVVMVGAITAAAGSRH